MKTPCKRCRDTMADALFSKLSEEKQGELNHHLAQCSRCQEAFGQIQGTLHLLDQEPVTQTDPAVYSRVWRRIEQDLDRDEQAKKPWFFKMVWVPAVAALIIMALLWLVPDSGPVQNADPMPDPSSPLAQYLNKAQPLLLSIANRSEKRVTATGFDPKTERAFAAELADEALQLRSELADQESGSMLSLLSDIELLLMQVSNLKTDTYEPGIELVQGFMKQRTILFKISLFEMRNQLS